MLFDDLEGVCGGIVFAGRLALSEAGDAQVVIGAIVVSASDADLRWLCQYTVHRPCTSEWEATHSGSDVCGTDVADVFNAAFGSPDGCLLLDEAHDGSCVGAGATLGCGAESGARSVVIETGLQ